MVVPLFRGKKKVYILLSVDRSCQNHYRTRSILKEQEKCKLKLQLLKYQGIPRKQLNLAKEYDNQGTFDLKNLSKCRKWRTWRRTQKCIYMACVGLGLGSFAKTLVHSTNPNPTRSRVFEVRGFFIFLSTLLLFLSLGGWCGN